MKRSAPQWGFAMEVEGAKELRLLEMVSKDRRTLDRLWLELVDRHQLLDVFCEMITTVMRPAPALCRTVTGRSVQLQFRPDRRFVLSSVLAIVLRETSAAGVRVTVGRALKEHQRSSSSTEVRWLS